LIRKNHQLGIKNVVFFGNVRQFKTAVVLAPDGLDDFANSWDGVTSYILDGNLTHGYGFKVLNNTLYGYTVNNGTSAITSLGTTLPDFARGYNLEAVNDAGITCKFYVDGILKGTQSTAASLPDTASTSDRIVYVSIDDDGTTPDTGGANIVHTVSLGEWFFIQEPQ